MAGMVRSSMATMPPSASSGEWLAQTMGAVVVAPEEVTSAARAAGFAVFDGVVRSVATAQPVGAQTGAAVVSGLGSLLQAPVGDAAEGRGVAAEAHAVVRTARTPALPPAATAASASR